MGQWDLISEPSLETCYWHTLHRMDMQTMGMIEKYVVQSIILEIIFFFESSCSIRSYVLELKTDLDQVSGVKITFTSLVIQ